MEVISQTKSVFWAGETARNYFIQILPKKTTVKNNFAEKDS